MKLRLLSAAALTLAALLIGVVPASATNPGGSGRVANSAPVNNSAEAPNWTRYYLGILGGYDRHTTDATVMQFESKDFSYGIAVGASYQIPRTMLVLGIHADYMFQNNNTLISEMDRSWSVLATGGVLISPNTQLYGGVGYTRTDGSFPSSLPPTGISMPDAGFTWAIGVETFLTQKLSAKFEYRNVDLGSTNLGVPGFDLAGDLQTFRFGLNYNF